MRYACLVPAVVALLLARSGAAAEPARELPVDPMATTHHWQLGGRRVNYVLGDSAVSVSKEQLRPGAEASLKLTYDFRELRRDYLSAYWTGAPVPGRCESVSFWLFGDGSGRPLTLAIEDASGRWYQRPLGGVDWRGWKQVTAPVGDGQGWRALRRQGDAAVALPNPGARPNGAHPGRSDGPVSGPQEAAEPALVQPVWLRQIAIERGAAAALQGAVYLSDLRATTEAVPLDFVEVTIATGQPGNRLPQNGAATLQLLLTNRGTAAAQGTVRLALADFWGASADLATHPVALAAGETATLAVPYTPTDLGAFTLKAVLAAADRPRRVFRQPCAVIAAAAAPVAAGLGSFGAHASISGFRESQMDTVFALNRDAGIRWERLTMDWHVLEPSPGAFVWEPPPTVAGAKGRAMSGPSGLATAADPRLDLQEALTLAFWLRADPHPGDWQWPVLKYADEPHRNYGVFLHKDTGVASFTAAFERGDRGPYWGLASDWSPWDGQWHHFAATYAAETGTLILYVDGREAKRDVLNAGRLRSGPNGVRLASAYQGDLDEVVLCDRALSAREIAALAARQDPPSPGLVAWWSFDDAQAPGHDRGPHGRHATAGRSHWLLDTVEQARRQNMHLLGILGFPPAWASSAPAGAARPWVFKPKLDDWERFVAATTRHFAGTIDHWEIWNEPNISVFWEPQPDAKDFLDVVRVGYAAAKRGNPACTVITPGLAGAGEDGFLDELIAAGAVPFCDAISIHPYRPTTPEESDVAGDLAGIVDRCAQHGGRRPLWITEWCWTTQIGGGSTEQRSALMTGRGIALALGTGLVDRIVWFRLADPGTDRFYSEDNYGLCYNDLTPKPAYFAFRTCARLLDGAKPVGELTPGAGLWARQFQRGDEVVLALWTIEGQVMAAVATGLRSVPVVDLMGNERHAATRDGVLFIAASEAVQFIRLRQPVAAVVVPAELRTPPKVRAGETAELQVVVRNPLAQASAITVDVGGLVERRLTAQVAAGATAALPLPFALPASLPPGRHRLTLAVQLGDIAWDQSAALTATAIPPGDALVGHWSFDEGQGTVLRDATPNALHGTITGCQWVPGRQGMALAFGGSSAQAVGGVAAQAAVADLVEIAAAPALDLAEEVTVAFWLKLTGDTGSWQFPVTKFRSNLARNYGMYVRPGDGTAAFSTSFVGGSAAHADVVGGPRLNDGQWHHLAATCALTEGRMAVYVDGRPVAQQSATPALMKTVDEPLRFGAGTKGIIDEVRVYGRALTATEISHLATEP